MKVLVVGGSASGKSAYAESLAMKFNVIRYYLATMSSSGDGAAERIERHRRLRAGKGFITVELESGMEAALGRLRSNDAVVLVEDLGNLVSWRLFDEEGAMADPEEVYASIMADVDALASRCENLVFVGNELGSDGVSYERPTRVYIELVGRVSCVLASRCETVVEVVARYPSVLKGELA